jgi:superfamily II DNA helicase RecQ
MHHLSMLRKFLGDSRAVFRCAEQGLGFVKVLEREEDLLVILPTSAGKSLLFMLPAFIEADKGMFSVVIVPLVSLSEDMVRRCHERGIRSTVWKGNSAYDPTASLVFVSPEDMRDEGFMTMLQQRRS